MEIKMEKIVFWTIASILMLATVGQVFCSVMT